MQTNTESIAIHTPVNCFIHENIFAVRERVRERE